MRWGTTLSSLLVSNLRCYRVLRTARCKATMSDAPGSRRPKLLALVSQRACLACWSRRCGDFLTRPPSEGHHHLMTDRLWSGMLGGNTKEMGTSIPRISLRRMSPWAPTPRQAASPFPHAGFGQRPRPTASLLSRTLILLGLSIIRRDCFSRRVLRMPKWSTDQHRQWWRLRSQNVTPAATAGQIASPSGVPASHP